MTDKGAFFFAWIILGVFGCGVPLSVGAQSAVGDQVMMAKKSAPVVKPAQKKFKNKGVPKATLPPNAKILMKDYSTQARK